MAGADTGARMDARRGHLLPDWWLVHPHGVAEVASLAAAPRRLRGAAETASRRRAHTPTHQDLPHLSRNPLAILTDWSGGGRKDQRLTAIEEFLRDPSEPTALSVGSISDFVYRYTGVDGLAHTLETEQLRLNAAARSSTHAISSGARAWRPPPWAWRR